MPEIRSDPVTGHRVIIAPERADRPDHYAGTSSVACPFCPGREAETPAELARLPAPGGGWRARVVPNKYPALAGPPDGAHEVVIESSRHVSAFSALSEGEAADVLGLWQARVRASRERGLGRVVVFKNEGAAAGASIEHVHSQVLAFSDIDVLPGPRPREGGCALCRDRDPSREVRSLDGFSVRVPHAPRFPHEIRIAPAAHRVRFEEEGEDAARTLARLILDALARLRALLGEFPYNLVVQTPPFRRPDFHWHVEILPRTSRPGGCEWGTGVFINTAAPEDSARRLREAGP